MDRLSVEEGAALEAMRETYAGLQTGSPSRRGRLPSAVFERLANVQRGPGRIFAEINLELVVRGRKHFTNTNAFRNRLFAWHGALRRAAGREGGDWDGVGHAPQLVRGWLAGLVAFHMDKIEAGLVAAGLRIGSAASILPTLSIPDDDDDVDEEASEGGGKTSILCLSPLVGQRVVITADLFAIREHALVLADGKVHESPQFRACLMTLLKFLDCIKTALNLAANFADSGAFPYLEIQGTRSLNYLNNRMLGSPYLCLPKEQNEMKGVLVTFLGSLLRRERWLLCLLSILLGLSRIFFQMNFKPFFTSSDSSSSSTATDSPLSRTELHVALCSVTKLIHLALSSIEQGVDLLNTIILQCISCECMRAFPPALLAAELERSKERVLQAMNSSTKSPVSKESTLRMRDLKSMPLLQIFQKEFWAFIKVVEEFTDEVLLDRELAMQVVMQRLFMFDPSKVPHEEEAAATSDPLSSSTVPSANAQSIGRQDGHTPNADMDHPTITTTTTTTTSTTVYDENPAERAPSKSIIPANFEIPKSFFFQCLRIFLGILVREFLCMDSFTKDPSSLGEVFIRDEDAGEVGRDNFANSPPYDPLFGTENSMRAQEFIIELARLALRQKIPLTAKVRGWEMLHMGEQLTQSLWFGRDGFVAVMQAILEEYIAETLRAFALNAKGAEGGGFQRFFYTLIRMEGRYHALTEFPSDPTAGKREGEVEGTGAAASAPPHSSPQELLCECRPCYYHALAAALARGPSTLVKRALLIPAVSAIHNYLEFCEGEAPPSPRAPTPDPTSHPDAGWSSTAGLAFPSRPRAGGPPRLSTLAELLATFRLVMSVPDAEAFFEAYEGQFRQRLTRRAPPVGLPDAVFDANLRRYEAFAVDQLAPWLDVHGAGTQRIRRMYRSLKRKVFEPGDGTRDGTRDGTGEGPKLVVQELDWRLWGKPSTSLELDARGEPFGLADAGRAPAGDNDAPPLPFPRDLWLRMQAYAAAADQAAGGLRRLCWGNPKDFFTTFRVAYPRCGRAGVVVHGTLLLQQLFLAIARAGADGVDCAVLAQQADLNEAHLRKFLHTLADDHHLLEGLHGDGGALSERVRLNAAFESPDGAEFNFMFVAFRPRGGVVAELAPLTKKQQEGRVKLISVVIWQHLKTVRRATYDELLSVVKEHFSRFFEPNRNMLKEAIDIHIGKETLKRDEATASVFILE